MVLSEEQVGEFTEAFSLFAGSSKLGGDTKKVEANKLDVLTRSLGLNLSDAELDARRAEVARDNVIRLEDFLSMMDRLMEAQAEDEDAELREAFRVFDRDGRGFIDRKELRSVMLNLGRGLTGSDVDEYEEQEDGESRLVDFEEFKTLLGS